MTKKRLFLIISFAILLLYIICVISNEVIDHEKTKIEYPNNEDGMVSLSLVIMTVINIFVAFPALLSWLSFTRSIYKIIKYNPTKYIKVCYTISASLAFLVFAFTVLYGLKLVTLDWIKPGINFTLTILIFTTWPSFIISFILGSIPVKRKKKDNV